MFKSFVLASLMQNSHQFLDNAPNLPHGEQAGQQEGSMPQPPCLQMGE